jgi:PTH1 family peptidyl-tRNA hydrolase
MVLDHLADDLGLSFREKTGYRMCNGSISGHTVTLVEPLSFMNRSGSAVKKVADRYAVPPEQIIVVHDDLDLETGRLKIRDKGSAGGHKGVDSIIQSLGSRAFIRIKIGIGRDPFVATETFVLSRFKKDELPLIKEAVSRAVASICCVVTDGVDKAMNRFNS